MNRELKAKLKENGWNVAFVQRALGKALIDGVYDCTKKYVYIDCCLGKITFDRNCDFKPARKNVDELLKKDCKRYRGTNNDINEPENEEETLEECENK